MSIKRSAWARRRGFTLAEILASMTVMSVLTLSLGSAILIASKAVPDAERTSTKLIQESRFADQISIELQQAIHITERTANAITFTVADRDGDGSPERIRYAWSGAAGDPLTLQYNGGSVVDVLGDVHAFGLAYDTQTVTEEYPAPLIESSEQLLSQHTAGTQDYYIDSGKWAGQFFHPDAFLPGNAVSWAITRVEVVARTYGNDDGETTFELRPANVDGTPKLEVLRSRNLRERDLSTNYQWTEVALDAADLPPGEGMCLVLKWKSRNVSAEIQYADNGGAGRLETSNAGNPWTYSNSSSILHKIWGTYKTLDPNPQTATRQYVTRVRMALQVGGDSVSRIDTSVHTMNAPEVLTAVWELDFDTDPTVLDMNADATADWTDYSGAFDPADLSNGIWYAPDRGGAAGISTVPNEDFAELTTVDMRYRASSVGGWGAALWINADREGGTSANIMFALYKPDAASQELWFGWELADGTDQWIAVYDVPDDLVNVRLVIDPAVDTVAVFVDGAHKSTYVYFQGNTDPARKAWVYTQDCAGEFDHVSLRVGGSSP